MTRSKWKSLNGLWSYAVTNEAAAEMPEAEGEILVPYCIESPLSGVGRPFLPGDVLWYRRTFKVPAGWKRTLLHFDAVDYRAEVWLNGKMLGAHDGGFSAFSFDITPYLAKGEQTLVVKVTDSTDSGFRKPVGKQILKRRRIRYTPVSGIWQTVWIEPVSRESYISDYKVHSDIKTGTIFVKPVCEGADSSDTVVLDVLDGGRTVASGRAAAGKEMAVTIPDAKLWSPDSPNLYDLRISLRRGRRILDSVGAYTSLREVSVVRDTDGWKRLTLNGKILFQFGVLDQGWWPDGLYTPASDEALVYDIRKTKEMGFNMIRKHEKVEPSRWYYWADRLGVLVWQDMPSFISGGNLWGKRFRSYGMGTDYPATVAEKANFYREYADMIDALDRFQCVVMWGPFNEGWGEFETGKVVEFTRAKDPYRLVNGASGGNWWKGQMGDVLDSHHYSVPAFMVKDKDLVNVIGEFGGLRNDQTARFRSQTNTLKRLSAEGCAAAVFTQTSDVETENNGIMTYDRRTDKIDVKKSRRASESLIDYASCIRLLPEENFNSVVDGRQVGLYTLRKGSTVVQITNFGARVVGLWTPDRNGHYEDVLCGYASLDEYLRNDKGRYVSGMGGPVAGRIESGSFVIDGRKYFIPKSDGEYTLNGGGKGLDMVVWDVREKTDTSVALTLVRPDGMEGYPGPLISMVEFSLSANGSLTVYSEVVTGRDAPVNPSYMVSLNLRGSGKGTVLGHELSIEAQDFHTAGTIGKRNDSGEIVLKLDKKTGLRRAATLYDPDSGRTLEVITGQSGIYFDAGSCLDGSRTDKYGNPISKNSFVSISPRTFAETLHNGNLSSVTRKANKVNKYTCIYKFGTR